MSSEFAAVKGFGNVLNYQLPISWAIGWGGYINGGRCRNTDDIRRLHVKQLGQILVDYSLAIMYRNLLDKSTTGKGEPFYLDNFLEQRQRKTLWQSGDELSDVPHHCCPQIRIHIPNNRVDITRLGTLQFRLINHNLPVSHAVPRKGGRVPFQQKSLQ
jgi:hypothetical protein